MKRKSTVFTAVLVVLQLCSSNLTSAGGEITDPFETGDFSKLDWKFPGDASWNVTSEEKNSGIYSAQAGSIDHDESTTLKVTLDCVAGDITFYYKVSSESTYDYLKFCIDGVEKETWSGEEDWAKVSFPVTAGTRTFEWTYSKDGSVSRGDDTAWIDDIVFPVDSSPEPSPPPPTPPNGYGAVEDFETNDFEKLPWEHEGDIHWTTTSWEKHSGNYSAQAGSIDHDESTTLKVTLNCVAGDITFYHKVSSESSYDYLKFYIDGVEKETWSGEEDWAEMSFPVTAGTRTFEWTYSKDGSESIDDDTAWIDDIVFPIATVPKIAYNSDPANGAKFVSLQPALSWSPGLGALAHFVYFGNDFDVVNNATAGARTEAATYIPGPLELEKTYYWRVDEFDGATTYKGDVWSFTTRPEIAMTTYKITASSYIGGSGADDSIRGCGIQSDGTVVLAANIGDATPGGLAPILLNGATSSSSGAIVRLSPDGTSVLSVTRIGDLVLDLVVDDSDNIYVALWTQGMAKLDSTATSILWQKEEGNVNRIDAGPAGYCTTLVVTEAEPDTFHNVVNPSIANIRVYNPNGSELGNFPGHRMTFDVCIDEATQTICHIGWKQRDDWTMGGPVQIANVQGRTYTGNVLWTAYDWSVDPSSSRYLNKSENNMADTRGYRCCIGRDGKLYCIYECAGGNHIFRYDPFDIMAPADIVCGDEWLEFWNTSAEHKTFIGRYEPATGEYLLGQQFLCRLEDYRGNTARVQLGEVRADELGRVYVGGRSAWGLPIPGHPRYLPAEEQIAFNPHNGYLGGGWFLVLSQDFKKRLYCTRLTASFSGHNDYTHAIAARVLSGTIANVAFAGSCSTRLYTRAAIQDDLQGDRDGWFAVIPPSGAPSILYVDASATGEGNGASWVNAFTDLQDAFAAAVAIPKIEVRVAQGVYFPDSGRLVGGGDRRATFQLINDVAFRGGYAGLGAPNPNARDIDLYKTILSGDIGGNDSDVDNPYELSTEPTRVENSRHVVTGSGTDATAILDGFTIMGGYADEWPMFGGGMYNESGSPAVTNCTFIGNWAISHGGGMCNRNSSSPILTNCTFIGNRAEDKGGGVCNVAFSSPTLNNCVFVGNSAEDGGGLYNEDNSSPNLINCDFRENSADDRGGGLGYELNCNPVLMNCMFTGNSARAGGGICSADGNPELTNCVFYRNSANGPGGGLAIYSSNAMLTSCTFSENSAHTGGGMSNEGTGTLTTVTNCTFNANKAIQDGGGVNWDSASQSVVNCIFSANLAVRGGGMFIGGHRPMLVNCTFNQNSADSSGGGVWAHRMSFPTLLNCILWGDTPEEIDLRSSGLITYSNIQGGWTGKGNISDDPLFADSENGDYHLKSQAGRWNPNSQSWVQDDVTSPCIDAGDPDSPVGDEPESNGQRINMGAFGGTPEASMSFRSK